MSDQRNGSVGAKTTSPIMCIGRSIIEILSYLSIYELVRRRLGWKPEEIPFWFTDVYVLVGAFPISIFFFFVLDSAGFWFKILLGISAYRLIELLCDMFRVIVVRFYERSDEQGHFLIYRDIGRGIVLTLINLYEVVLYFSVFYLFWGKDFYKQICDPITAFYQSFLTMTTLGYGDIHPTTSNSKMIVIFQLFFFVVFVLFKLPILFQGVRVK